MNNTSNLKWKTILGFPDYAVTPDGQIWSYKRNKFLKPYQNRGGYLDVTLSNDRGKTLCRVHRLVGMAFVPLPPEFNNHYDTVTIDHIDGNKLNNHYTNLEWVTREENIKRAWENGYCNCNHLKKSCFCISIEDEKYTPFDSASEMAQRLNLPEPTVYAAINKGKGIIQGKYIVGYTENLDQKYLSPKPDAVGIIQLYSDAIANYTPHRKEGCYKPRNRKECFCISIIDKKYTPFDSAVDIDESLNLPKCTTSTAINQSNGIIQGKYIVGYTENLDEKYLLPEPDAVGIIQLYSDAIANYKPRRKECFYIDSLDNSYHESNSISDIDEELNLPIGTTSNAIYKTHGLIRGRYIAGRLNDHSWKKIFKRCSVEQIVKSYANQIERYKQRGSKKITNLKTGESKEYKSLADFAREHGLYPTNAGRYLENHPDLYKVELA